MRTFLFSDVEGSTQRWERNRDAMAAALARHDALMRNAIAAHNGTVFKTIGDAFCAAFPGALEAVAAAVDAQRRLQAQDFAAVDGLAVRMALSTGTADERDGDFFGPAVNRVARLVAVASGGQILVSRATSQVFGARDDVALLDLGEHRLKGLNEPERIFQLVAEGLPVDFPPLRSMDAEEVRPTPGFAGRDAELAALAAVLDRRDAVAAICGLGGTGKSSLAREYAWRNRSRYAAVWWLNAQTESGIIDGLLRLGALFVTGLDRLPDRRDAARQVILRALGESAKPSLLIFDNLDDELLLRAWLPRTNCRIVVTSRNAAWSADITPIQLETWSLETATGFLRRESRRADLSNTEARAIAQALGFLPLALAHAAASLRGARMLTPARYLERIGLYLKNAPRGVEYPCSVFATFSTSIAQAEQEADGAALVLRFAAAFAPDPIPDELFAQPVDAYAVALRPLVADPLRLDEALAALDRLSLMAFSQDSRTYAIHRLVALAAKDTGGYDLLSWQEHAVEVADAAFPRVEFGSIPFATWPQCERLLPHARAALDALPEQTAFLCAAHLAGRCAVYLRERGEYGAAEPLQLRALAIAEKAIGRDDVGFAIFLHDLGAMYHARGRYEEAEPPYARALAILERDKGPDDLDVAMSLNDLGMLYERKGNFAAAQPLLERALLIWEKAFGPDHAEVATSLNNLGFLYFRQRRYAEAEPLYARAVAIDEKTIGPDNPGLAYSLSGLAVLYREQGRFEEAERIYLRALLIRENALGVDHPDVARSLNNLAALYRRQGRDDEAEPLLSRALRIWEKTLSLDHPDAVATRNALGDLKL